MADEPQVTSNPAETFQKLLDKKNNDAMALASQLFDENYTLRTTVRELTGKQPAEGAMVLSPENVKKWKAYEDLGADPKDIKKALDRVPQLEAENKSLSHAENLFKLADLGLDGSKLDRDVLKEQVFDKYPDAVVSYKKEKNKDGQEAEVAYIKTAADSTELSFNEFASQSLAKYLPALKINAENTHQQPPAPGNTHDPKPQGAPASVFDRIRQTVAAEQKQAAPPTTLAARFGKPANA